MFCYEQALIHINEAPSGGHFEIFPVRGTALLTTFNFAASDWSDDINDYPLKYRFISK